MQPKLGKTSFNAIGYLLITCWLGFIFRVVGAESPFPPAPPPQLLILNSYHPGHVWGEAELSGMLSVIERERPQLDPAVEYLDFLRYNSDADETRMVTYLRDKYGAYSPPVVLISDQWALNFFWKYRSTLFPKSQVAFCGVEVPPTVSPDETRWFTGVMEKFDPIGTIQLIRRLQPDLQRLLIHYHDPVWLMRVRQQMAASLPELTNQIAVEFIAPAPVTEILTLLENLDLHTAVIIPSSAMMDDTQRIWKNRSGAPIYGLQSPNQLDSTVGGSMSDGHAQGEIAARLALRMLNGAKANDLPVVENPPFRLVVDYREMQRFGFSLAALPPGTEILNRPISFFDRHRNLLFLGLGVITVLSFATAILGWNVRQRQRVESALRASEQRFRMLVENSHDVIAELNEKGHVLYISPNVQTIVGEAPESFLGRGTLRFVHPDDREAIHALFRQTPFAGTCRYQHADGTWHWLEMAGQHFQTPKGQKRVVLIARDVTERKRTEEARLELESHLGQSEKMQALGTLAGGIAHDFNNLLTAIIGNTELLHMDVGRLPMAQESLNQIQDAAGRAKDLVQQILTFSRPQLHKREPIQLSDAVAEALKLVTTALPANVKLHTSFAQQLPLAEADASQIHQIVINLCTNAVHAMEERGGFLSVALEAVNLDEAFTGQNQPLQPGRHVCLMVSDTGIGMEPDTVKRIFEPFYTTKVQGKGTGLGLSVVHGIVRKHEGAIVVHSRPHMGTRFSVYFRAVNTTELTHQTTNAAPLLRAQGEHVMLLDDEPLVANTGRRILEGLGYRTTVFNDPVKALEAFQFEPFQFSLVITDLTMPSMSGITLARELLTIRPDIPILLVTGFGGNIELESVTEVGVRGLVGKPFTAEQLAFQIRRCLAEKPVA